MIGSYRETEKMRDSHDRIKALAQFVFETRKKKGLSQPGIRAHGGPSLGWLGELEAGTMTTMPKPATLKKLARALGVPNREVFELVDLEPYSPEEKDLYRINTRDDRRQFLEALKFWEYPPTPEETNLILNMADAPSHSVRRISATIFQDPPDQRRDALRQILQGEQPKQHNALDTLEEEMKKTGFWIDPDLINMAKRIQDSPKRDYYIRVIQELLGSPEEGP